MADHLKYDPVTGHLMFGPNGHLARCPSPASCPGDNSASYRIQDYDNDDWTVSAAGGECLGGFTGDTSFTDWDGVFAIADAANCLWEAGDTNYNVASGRAVTGSNPDGRWQMAPTAANFLRHVPGSIPPRWEIRWQVEKTGTRTTVWEGRKTTGSTPAGIYTRNNGCESGITSITVEAVP